MKRTLCLLALAAAMLASPASAQEDLTQHAAVTVAHLHDAMLNPSSFVLDGVFTTKPDKRGHTSICYQYRSQNALGGMSVGLAVEDGGDKGRLSTFTVTGSDGERADDMRGYNAGWVAPCKGKNMDREITNDVVSAAPALYRKTR